MKVASAEVSEEKSVRLDTAGRAVGHLQGAALLQGWISKVFQGFDPAWLPVCDCYPPYYSTRVFSVNSKGFAS